MPKPGETRLISNIRATKIEKGSYGIRRVEPERVNLNVEIKRDVAGVADKASAANAAATKA